MNSNEAITERLKVNLEKLKMVLGIIILLTGGLLTLSLNGLDNSVEITIFVVGNTIEFFFLLFYLILNRRINYLIHKIEI